jgi:hypothetical protein
VAHSVAMDAYFCASWRPPRQFRFAGPPPVERALGLLL